MFKNKAKMKGFIGIVIILAAILLIFVWETYGREALTYQDVLVLKEDVEAHTVISKDMLGYLSLDADTILWEPILDPQQVIGKETITAIPKATMLSDSWFAETNLAVGEGEFIFAIPETWIYNFPQTLRRGDTLYFYPINTSEFTTSVFSGDNAILEATVSYVKDSTNKEVVDVTPQRIDGTSSVSDVSVIITPEQYRLLKNAFEAGYQFVLLYR